MRIKFADNEAIYTRLCYENNIFLITDESGENQIECIPQVSVICEHDPSNFQLIFLHNERDDYSENSIYPVRVEEPGNPRIGWIFPFQALLSKEHDQANNQYFLKYAYVAYYLLLSWVETKSEEELMQPEKISLNDFYPDDMVILLLDKTNMEAINNFCLDEYVVDLYRKGYSYNGSGNLISQQVEKPDAAMNLKKISSELEDFMVINEIFKESIPRKYDIEFARFYAYYQVIELLISAVFNCKFKEFVNNIQADTKKLFDDREELNTMVNEKHRIRWLFAEFTNISSVNSAALDDNCKKFLSAHGKKTADTPAENLYSVRCLLVHELYNIKTGTDTILKEINDIFLDILLEMLFSFKSNTSVIVTR